MDLSEVVVVNTTGETVVISDTQNIVQVTGPVASPTIIEVLAGTQGVVGPANVLNVGTVVGSAPGSQPAVTITGTSPSQVINFTLPTGATGPANTLAIGTVTTGTASATITGTAPNQTLNLVLPPGPANALAVGTVTPLVTGATPTVTITGTSPSQTINFGLPAGPVGPAPNLSIGTTTTGAAGSNAVATITGTNPNYSLNLTLPTGATIQWYSGSAPPATGTGVVNDWYVVNTGGTGLGDVYKKTGASTWTLQGNIRGAAGTGNVSSGAATIGNLVTYGAADGSTITDAGFAATDIARLSTAQTFSGAKTFSQMLTVNNIIEVNNGGEEFRLKAGASDHGYMAFYPRTATPGTRGGYFGYVNAATTTLSLVNETSAGLINIATVSNGNINLNAGTGTISLTGSISSSGNIAAPAFVGSGTLLTDMIADNLIPNGNFEQPITLGYLESYGTGTYVSDTAEKFVGANSLKVTTGATGRGVIIWTGPRTTSFEYPANTTFIGAAWIKGTAGQTVNIASRIRSAASSYITESAGTMPYTLTGSWQRIFTAPFTYATGPFIPGLQIVINGGDTSQPFWIDNVCMFEGNVLPNYESPNAVLLAGTQTITGLKTFSSAATFSAQIQVNSNIYTGTGSELRLFNTADQTTNYERIRQYWNTNVAYIQADAGGTGQVRDFVVGVQGGIQSRYSTTGFSVNGFSGKLVQDAATTGVSAPIIQTGSMTASSLQNFFTIMPFVNQTGAAGYTALFVNPVENTTGSGTKNLAIFAVGGVTKASISSTGVITGDGSGLSNVVLTTGNQTIAGAKTFSSDIAMSGGALLNTHYAGSWGPPTFTTRSAGTRILVHSGISSSSADYAIGIDTSTLWNSVGTTAQSFKWYGGTTLAATLTGTGNLTAVGSVTATSFIGDGSALTGLGSNTSLKNFVEGNVVGGHNYYADGGFENGLGSASTANGATIAISTAQKHSGTNSVLVTCATTALDNGLSMPGLSSVLTVNRTYIGTAWVYIPSATAPPGGVRISAQGVGVSANVNSQYVTTVDRWVKVQMQFVTAGSPGNVAFYAIASNTTAGQTFYVDDVAVQEMYDAHVDIGSAQTIFGVKTHANSINMTGAWTNGASTPQLVIGATGSAGAIAFARASDGSLQGGIGYISQAESNILRVTSNGGSGQIDFSTGGATRLSISSAGHLYPSATNSYDTGLSANRWRTVYATDVNITGTLSHSSTNTRAISITHTLNSAEGLLLTNTGVGQGNSPRIFFQNEFGSNAMYRATNAVVVTVGATPGSASGTGTFFFNDTGNFTATSLGGNGFAITSLNAANVSGVFPIGNIPTGTTGTTVALGNHTHAGVYEGVITAGTTAQYYRGDKTWQTLDKTAVGLSLVNNVAQVEIAGTQTITGAKTFSSLLTASAGVTVTGAITSTATTNSLNTQRFIFTTAGQARPTGTAYVEWVGPVQPTNAIDGDTWVNTA